jgi:hypothetical protein
VCNISKSTVELFAELGFEGMKWVKPLPNLKKEQTPTPKGKRRYIMREDQCPTKRQHAKVQMHQQEPQKRAT